MKLVRLIGGLGLIAAVLVMGLPYVILKSASANPNFKPLVEKKLSEFLNSDVTIERIHIGLINRVFVSGIDVHAKPDANDPGYNFKIGKAVLRYNILQLLSRNFASPSGITLKAPEISIQNEVFPYTFFQKVGSAKPSGTGITDIDLQGGSVRVVFPGTQNSLVIQDIQGSFKPSSLGKLSADFSATLSGMLTGMIEAHGEIDIYRRQHHLQIDLKSLSFPQKLPLENFNGKITWINDSIDFEALEAQIYGWKITLSGDYEHYEKDPRLDLLVHLKDAKNSGELVLRGDLSTKSWESALRIPHHEFTAKGDLILDNHILRSDAMMINNLYEGKFQIDLLTGDYEMRADDKEQEYKLASNLQGQQYALDLDLHHCQLFKLDIVTKARILLTPYISQWEKRLTRFQGEFKTDYFVVNYAPFEDLRGDFDLTPSGVQNLTATWGGVFQADGKILALEADPQVHLHARVNGFDLTHVREFAKQPLSKPIGGMLEGDLNLDGSLVKPEVMGNFVVKQGFVDNFDYDRGTMQFRGFLPYLKLQDSFIVRGRTQLPLIGALNLKLSNPFYSVDVETVDKIVLFHGWELSSSQKDKDLELNPGFAKFASLTIGPDDSSHDESQIKKDDDRGSAVVFGPKFRF